MRKSIIIFMIFILTLGILNAKEFGDWKVKGTSNYRFAEQYGLQDRLSTGEQFIQRLDFTFSKRKGWEMTLTTSFLAEADDTIKLIVDNKEFLFYGQGVLHKQSFKIDKTIVDAVKNSKSIVIEENYNGGMKLRSVFSSKGSFAALLWVSDL